MAYASWSVVYGEQPSAAKWNILGTNDAHFYSFLGANLAWQSWTPTFTNLSGGTIQFAKYTQVGKTVNYYLKYQLAGAGVAGAVKFTLPVTPSSMYDQLGISLMGIAHYRDAGTASFEGLVLYDSGSTVECRVNGAAATYVTTGNLLSSTIPFTWANTDQIHATGTYEAA